MILKTLKYHPINLNTTKLIVRVLFSGVMILSAVLNHFRLYKLNTVDKFVMAYGGLRGAVAFALALLISPHHVKQREMFITTTIAVIYFTVFIQVTVKFALWFHVAMRLT